MAESQYTIIGGDEHLYYGTCSTAKDERVKDVVIQNPTIYVDPADDTVKYLDLNTGDQLIITFEQGNENIAPSLSLSINESNQNIAISNGTGRIVVDSRIDIDCSAMWEDGETVTFLYTVRNNQSYWKMTTPGPASEDRFGTVKIANENTDISQLDDNTAITYGMVDKLVAESTKDFGFQWINRESDDDGWGKLLLGHGDGYSNPLIIPEVITHTNQLINNGDEPDGKSIYLTNNNNILFMDGPVDENTGKMIPYGIGYIDTTIEGQPRITKNFIPYDFNTNSSIRTNNVRVGYGSLKNYQEEEPSEESQDYEDNRIEPLTWTYGKEVYTGIDKNGSYQIGISDIPQDTFDPLYTFGADQATFMKPLIAPNIKGTTTMGTINANEITVGDETVTGTLDVANLNVGGQPIKDLIRSRISPIDVTVGGWYEGNNPTTELFFVKRIKSDIMYATANSHFLLPTSESPKSCHMQWEAPIVENYTVVGVVGYNVDGRDTGDQVKIGYDNASYANVWECFYHRPTNKIDVAMRNFNSVSQEMYLYIDLLYVRNEWPLREIEEVEE